MIVDYKPNRSHWPQTTRSQAPATPSTSERKLSIELPSETKIYTAGSLVTGIVHLGSKELERIEEVQVSLVCTVRSIFYRNYGQSRDYRRETTKLMQRVQTIWSSNNGWHNVPPADLPFEIILPDVGNDRRDNDPNAPLPPSFHAGRHGGWKKFLTYGALIGFVKYYVKVSVVRKGPLTLKEKATCPFIFLPPSPPPPLLPSLPQSISGSNFRLPEDTWFPERKKTTLRQSIFTPIGQAHLELWLPRVPSFPRLISIPFFLCLKIQTRHVRELAVNEPSKDVLPLLPQIDKASIFLRQTIRVRARRGKQSHEKIRNASPTDNLLCGIMPEEGSWSLKSAYESETLVGYWEKQYLWRGLWICRETPNFANRQLTLEYALVAHVPIIGLGNDAKLVSRTVEISSGVTQGESVPLHSEEDMLDLPPDYFVGDGAGNEEDEERAGKW